ncbi:hypothetical protein BCR36DRAFT_320387 [Piromyces finnis]|uniref:Calponin-homology (CH) domain-containing protein n=1 Tax=Piromyces finnis TaxID=1754191 RepID=A0A1Y1VIC6_9FUNG|nr:hypothetical protein BCR36DRAFT_320387 [Piromyces finnis]|eukprot:ORX55852.1 hypothetical protein BCR36DRAFT_320387 [Piromyces finnis]
MLQNLDILPDIEYDGDDKILKMEENQLLKSNFHVITLNNKDNKYASDLRVEPKEINIFDFEVETHYPLSIKISNSSREIQKLLLKPPENSYLTIHESCKKYIQGFELAPGLSVKIKLDLFIPVVSKSSMSCISNADSFNEKKTLDNLWYQDELAIIMNYNYSIKVPIKAYPPEPQLIFTEYIDFGKQMCVPLEEKNEIPLSCSSKLLSHSNQSFKFQPSLKSLPSTTDKSNINSVKTQSISNIPQSIQLKEDKYSDEDWKWAIVKTFTITNSGKVRTKFTINYDESAPIKVFPTTGILDPLDNLNKSYYIIPSVKNENSIEITIQLLPCIEGTLNETLYINIEEEVNRLSTAFKFSNNNSNQNKVKTIIVHADILKHSLTILDHNKEELNIQDINFKSIYYSQKHEIKAYIYNNDKQEIKYSIINSNALTPLLPPKKVFDFQNEIFSEKELKTCITMTPHEGIIKPNQLFPIKFNFAPTLPPIIKGFKSIRPVYPSKKYVTNLTLKIENADNNKPEYYPVNFQLSGEAHPTSIFVSNTLFEFTPTPLHFESVKKLKITNRSKTLPLSFYIKQIAHFKIKPSQGVLKPEEIGEFDVTFKPNQFGTFRKKIEILFFNKSVDTYIPPNLNKKDILEILNIKVQGSSESVDNENCRFPEDMYHNKHIEEINKTYIYEELRLCGPRQIENPERTSHVQHRKLYDMYIRMCYNNRELKKNLKLFNNNDFFNICKNFGIHEDYSKIDITNGLMPPEPIIYNEKNGKNFVLDDKYKHEKKIKSQIHKESSEFEMLLFNNFHKYSDLFNKLSKSIVINPSIPCNLSVDQVNNVELTTYDLIMIFSSTKTIDFGEISCHSVNRFPLNILNGTINKIPIHIKFDNTELENVSIEPSERSISPMDIGGFEIIFKSDVPGNYLLNLEYSICNRYLYSIPVNASVLPPKIEIDVNTLNFNIDFNVISNGTTSECEIEIDRNINISKNELLSPADTEEKLQNFNIDLPYKEKTVTLKNNGNFDVKYSWSLIQNNNISSNDNDNTLLSNKIPDVYKLINYNGIFYLENIEGVIKKNSSITVLIKYFPSIKNKNEHTLILNTIDYNTDTIIDSVGIKCNSYYSNSKCNLTQASKTVLFDFGVLNKSNPKKTFSFNCFNYDNHQALFLNQNFKVIKISNKGNSPSFYCIKPYDNTDIFIENKYGVIEANSILELKMWVNPTKIGVREDAINVIIFGEGKNIKIPIKYECVSQNIEIKKSECEFKLKTIIGNSFSGDVILYNSTRATSTLLIDLRKYPEFEIKYGKAMKFLTPYEVMNKNILNGIYECYYKYSGIRELPQMSDLINYFNNMENFTYDASIKSNLYLIDIAPGERLNFQIIYKPEKVCSYKFDIPIQTMDKNEKLYIPVLAESIVSPLALSKLKVYFENSIIREIYNESYISENFEDIEMTNQSENPIKWKLEFTKKSQNENVFSFSDTSGKINVNKKFKLRIFFKPTIVGNFSENVSIYFGTDDYNNVICLTLNGNSVKPYILFDPPELYFPVVPFNEVSVVTFNIINFGCNRNELKSKIQNSTLEQVGLIDIYFPEGRLLKSSGEKLNVILQFVSINKKVNPISFSSVIEFSEDIPNSTIYYLPIYGTSSNSCFTLFSYLWNLEFTKRQEEGEINNETLKLDKEKEEKKTPIEIINENKKRLRLLSTNTLFFTPNGIILNENTIEEYNNYLDDLADVATRWLSNNTSYNITEDSFPKCFVENHGEPLIEIIDDLCGSKKNKVKRVSINRSYKHKERVMLYYKQYQEIINNLKLWGALVSNVNPLYLLSKENFIMLQDEIIKDKHNKPLMSLNCEAKKYYCECRENFEVISKEVWVTILFQIINVFILKNVTLKQYLSFTNTDIRNISNTIEELMNHDNIYSVSEHILFSWVKARVDKKIENENNEFSYTCLINKNFQNFSILSDLLCSYIPSLKIPFADINKKSQSQNYHERNSKIFIKVLDELLCTNYPKISVGKVILGNIYEILLLLAFLYQLLPSLSKIQTIEFTGKLREPQSKTIEILNNSNQEMQYSVIQSGSLDFKLDLEDNSLYLKEKASRNINIDFIGKFSKRVSSLIRFIPKIISFNHVTSINYRLVSNITEVTLENTIYIESPLFKNPPFSVNMEIKNPYDIEGVFKVILYEEVSENEYSTCKSFKLTKTEIKLLPNKPTTFNVLFLPIKLGTYNCIVHFINEKIGEFMYKIEGKTIYPLPSEVFNWTCRTGKTLRKIINVPFNNENKDYIIKQLDFESDERYIDEQISEDNNGYSYIIEYSSEYFSGPKELSFSIDTTTTMKNIQNDGFDIPISFTPEFSGKYSCFIVVKNKEHDDIRVFLINCTAIPEGKKAKLEFNAPSRKEIVQKIPIINNTDNSWTIKSNLKGNNFSTPLIINVKAHSTEDFPIIFKSQIPCRVEGNLILTNLQNNQKYEFDLLGISTEPLAEDNIIINRKAREIINYSFPVCNYSDTNDYFTISTDLPIASSNNPIYIKAGETKYCDVKLYPKSSGIYNNSITFSNKNMTNYVWFNVELNIEKPDPEGQILLSSDVRKAVTLVLNITNKTEKTVQYKILYKGDCLSGKKSISILPNSVYEYELVYSPILPGKSTGYLMFHNELIGDFWYILNFEAKESPTIELPIMECPLGKNSAQSIIISNPTSQTVNVNIHSTNSREFQIIEYEDLNSKSRHSSLSSLILNPNEKKKVGIHYWPCSLGQESSSKITFSSNIIGNSVYFVKGHGLKPELMDETLITAILGDITTSILSFNNPLSYSTNVTVDLVSDTNTFQLLMKKNTFHISGNGSTEIPYTFIPKGIMKYNALLNVTTEFGLCFSYPLIGVVETSVKNNAFEIEGNAKQVIEKTLEVPLINYIYDKKKLKNKEKTFSVNIESINNIYDPVIETMKLSLKKIKINEEGIPNMIIKVIFSPSQVMNKKLYLIITENTSGGRWKYNLHVISHPSPIDDIITIEGSINVNNCVSFSIKNYSEVTKKFRAFFDETSPPEFSIQPEYGQLVPESQRGENDNQFIIIYKPSYYGKILTGKLSIVCKDISWSYLVRGVPPKINLSKSRKGNNINTINTSFLNNQSSKTKKINYIKKNINLNNLKK